MEKLYDLAVKDGSYVKKGETKNKWLNVGSLMENEHGKFIFLKKSFNPAGIESQGSDVLVSLFKPKSSGVESMGTETKSAPDMENPFSDEDIPF